MNKIDNNISSNIKNNKTEISYKTLHKDLSDIANKKHKKNIF